jgi:hypothetical protein
MPMDSCAVIALSRKHLMSITTLSTTSHAPQTNIPLTSNPCAQGFASLQNALQAGDLAAARRAYEMFWQDIVTQTGTGDLFLPDAQTSHDLQAVGNSLKLANIPGAQRAFAMFRRDMLDASPSAPLQVLHSSSPFRRSTGGATTSIPNSLISSLKSP